MNAFRFIRGDRLCDAKYFAAIIEIAPLSEESTKVSRHRGIISRILLKLMFV